MQLFGGRFVRMESDTLAHSQHTTPRRDSFLPLLSANTSSRSNSEGKDNVRWAEIGSDQAGGESTTCPKQKTHTIEGLCTVESSQYAKKLTSRGNKIPQLKANRLDDLRHNRAKRILSDVSKFNGHSKSAPSPDTPATPSEWVSFGSESVSSIWAPTFVKKQTLEKSGTPPLIQAVSLESSEHESGVEHEEDVSIHDEDVSIQTEFEAASPQVEEHDADIMSMISDEGFESSIFMELKPTKAIKEDIHRKSLHDSVRDERLQLSATRIELLSPGSFATTPVNTDDKVSRRSSEHRVRKILDATPQLATIEEDQNAASLKNCQLEMIDGDSFSIIPANNGNGNGKGNFNFMKARMLVKASRSIHVGQSKFPATNSLLDSASEVGTDVLSCIDGPTGRFVVVPASSFESGDISALSHQRSIQSSKDSIQNHKIPLGSSNEELKMLNLFMSIAGPKLSQSNLSCDDREQIHNRALRMGLPEDFINKVLDQSVGIRRWEDDQSPTSCCSSETWAAMTKQTTETGTTQSTTYTRDEESISYQTLGQHRGELSDGYGCFGNFKSSFWLESGMAADEIRQNVVAVISRDSESFENTF